MSIAVFCDICKDPAVEGRETGLVEKRHYCEEHWSVIEKYLKDRDVAQEAAQEKWRRDMAKLRKALRKDHPEALLPDEMG